ncbi:MAG: glycosyltransferase family 2 protein [Candidatus Micrarchaeia archaeon]
MKTFEKDGSIDLSVVLPCKNESKTIGVCIEKILRVFEREKINGEIIVADSSTDKSAEVAKKLGARVVVPWNAGYGNAYLAGFAAAQGKFVVMGDADNTYDFDEIPRLLEPLKSKKADFVLGSRLKGKIMPKAMPWLHQYVGNPALSALLNLFFSTNFSDTHCGFRAITKKALDGLDLHATGMEFASEMVIKASKNNLRTVEVPITYYARQGQAPHLRTFSDGWRHLRFMLLYAPNYLFMVPGFFMLVLGLILLSTLVSGPVNVFGFFLDIHPLFIGSMLSILGFQVLIMGLFTKVYAVNSKLEKPSKTIFLLYKYFTLERATVVGLGIIAVGILFGLTILYDWYLRGFGNLFEIRRGIIALTFLVLGTQFVFSAFFLSILGIEKR